MEAPPPIDPMVNLIATTRLHLLRLETAVAKGGELAATLTPLRDDRKAHLKALEAELARTTPKPSGSSTSPAKPAAPGSVTLPADAEAIVAAIRGDAATAQLQFTDAITIVARYRAAILGTVAASLATHRSVLA